MTLVTKLLCGLFLFFSLPVFAEDSIVGNLKFDSLVHDFGDVYRGQTVVHRFVFTNAGQGPIVVQGVHAACGCTAVEVDKGKKYLPGESGFIEVKLDTTAFLGSMVKTVTVLSNEKLLPDRILTVRAMVKTDLMADPPLLDFGDVHSREGAKKSVKINAIPPFPLKVSGLIYNQDLFAAQLVPAGPNYLLQLSLKPGVAPSFLRESIVLKTNSKFLPEMVIPIRATVKGNIEFAPHYIEFGAIEPKEQVRRSLSLKGLTDFNITGSRIEMIINGQKIDQSDKYLTITTLNHEKDKKLVSVSLKNELGIAGSVHGKLYLLTSDKDQKDLAVDFYAFFR
jgi:hypothetical protein